MARHLARIHGTEEDKVNCPFYFKIGACRHSDRCSRLHHKPAFSPTILIKHLYRHPMRQAEMQEASGLASGTAPHQENTQSSSGVSNNDTKEHYLNFFEDLYTEFGKFGRIDALHVCDNLGDHMIGHVYCKFIDEEEASDALQVMNNRHYDGRRMEVEFSPVTDFREARCRDYDEDVCARGGFCNFLHVKPVPLSLIRSMEEECEQDRMEHKRRQQQQQDHPQDQSSSSGKRRRSPKDDNSHHQDNEPYGDDHKDNGDGDGRDGSRDDRRSRKRHHRHRDRKRERREYKDRDRDKDRGDRKRSSSRKSSRSSRNASPNVQHGDNDDSSYSASD